MHTIEIPDKNITLDFPSEVDEMNNEQFVCYVELVLQYVIGSINKEQLQVMLVQKLMDLRMSYRVAFLYPEEKEECETNILRLAELMESFLEDYEKDGKLVKSFKLKSTRNFVPRILGYHGPKDGFENVTFCEYRIARNYFRKFAETNEESYLNSLVAILYRPSKWFTFFRRLRSSWDGEIRQAFTSKSNQLSVEKRAKRISKVPYHIRYCVFLYFCGCEDYLKSGRPIIDGLELDFSQLYTDASGDDKGNVGMVGLLFSLAETGVFGNIEQTDSQHLWDIMVRVYQVVMQARAFDEKIKKNGTSS
jgi:hypothetical protein